ncbi:DUF1413 domain-containing protein [Corallococcus exiguus]|uniref:DUF1413 domain-containing protein n=1 Tax=Corallococcus exiguus TaxID=83462 RepID=UPI001471B0D3|nr:DUF1413 domain-containing protein [Corallococcus exiguus]NNC17643.1 DUF1413 domain-containing protein [Corallococcus exiguus]
MSAQVNEVLAEAIETFRSKRTGHRFQLSELFAADRWEAIPVGVRRHAGTVFLKWAEAHLGEVECLGPDDENHQQYRKLS